MEGTVPRSFERDNLSPAIDALKTLSVVSKAIQEARVSIDSFEEILKLVGEIIDFRSASIFMITAENGKLEEVCKIGNRVDLIDFVEFDMGTGISAWVAKKRRPILLNNLRKSKGGVHIRSFLSAPIVFGQEIIGVVNLAHDEPEAFDEDDASALDVVSTLFALLSERINHLKTVTASKKEIESLKDQLKNSKFEISRTEESQIHNYLSDTSGTKLANSLAIIAGNAQFLLMTMKNSSNSVVRRLKAINKEAANIMDITGKGESHVSAESDLLNILKHGPEA